MEEKALRERMEIRINLLGLLYRQLVWSGGRLPSELRAPRCI